MPTNPKEILRFLKGVADHGHVVELAWSDPGRDAITHAEHFKDLEDLAERAASLSSGGANCYFTPAMLRDGVGARARDDDAIGTTVLWCDLDTPAAMCAHNRNHGQCYPSVTVLTRIEDRRAHLYWVVDPPVWSGAEIKRLNSQIAAKMQGDTAVTNPARLMRLPGTTRWPTERKPIGPFHVGAWFDAGAAIYTAAEIDEAFPAAARNRCPRDYGVGGPGTDWDRFLEDGIQEGERNSKLFSLTGKLLSANLSPYLVTELIQAVNCYACEPPLDEGEVDDLVCSCCKRALRGAAGDG